MSRPIFSLIACMALSACVQPMLDAEPPGGTVPHNERVLVNDGTCPAGQIKEITGGNNTLGIPRTRRCITMR